MRFLMTLFHLNTASIRHFLQSAIGNTSCAIALCLLAILSSFTLHSAELKMLALVSDRSAASMVTGAHQYLADQAEKNDVSANSSITIRSVSQLNQLTNTEIQLLLISTKL